MTIDVNGPRCNCGNIGCLEVLASGKAVGREAQRAIAWGAKGIILELADGEVQNITAKIISIAAQKRDELALTIVSRAAIYLGVGMVNLVNAFNTSMIFVGGGMANIGGICFLVPPGKCVLCPVSWVIMLLCSVLLLLYVN